MRTKYLFFFVVGGGLFLVKYAFKLLYIYNSVDALSFYTICNVVTLSYIHFAHLHEKNLMNNNLFQRTLTMF